MLNLLPDHVVFLDRIFSELNKLDMDVSMYELDHICYRVETLDRYNQLKLELGKWNKILGEDIINERPIINFQLSKPLIYQDRIIEVLEVPAPKFNSFYKEGYEHVEFVINEDLEDFRLRYSALNFDASGLKKERNRDLRLKFRDISAKFHEQSLKQVIKEEQLNQ